MYVAGTLFGIEGEGEGVSKLFRIRNSGFATLILIRPLKRLRVTTRQSSRASRQPRHRLKEFVDCTKGAELTRLHNETQTNATTQPNEKRNANARHLENRPRAHSRWPMFREDVASISPGTPPANVQSNEAKRRSAKLTLVRSDPAIRTSLQHFHPFAQKFSLTSESEVGMPTVCAFAESVTRNDRKNGKKWLTSSHSK